MKLWRDFSSISFCFYSSVKIFIIIRPLHRQQYSSDQTLITKSQANQKVIEGFESQPGVARIYVDSLSSLERRLDDPTDHSDIFIPNREVCMLRTEIKGNAGQSGPKNIRL